MIYIVSLKAVVVTSYFLVMFNCCKY